MRNSFFSFFIFIIIFSGCTAQEQGSVFTLGNFSNVYAGLEKVHGQVLVNGKSVIAKTLLGEGDTVSTGTGELVLRHDNGTEISALPGTKIKIFQSLPYIVQGRALVKFPEGIASELNFEKWKIRAQNSYAEVVSDKISEIYVLKGEILIEKDGVRKVVSEGNLVRLDSKPLVKPVTWWKNSYADMDFNSESSESLIPGQGTLGARKPGMLGKAYIPLVVSSMKVKIKITEDLAITEVKQVFFNPYGYDLEGIYRFKTPEGAVINDFAVDRNGKLVFGKIKGKELAKQQYSSHVYQGSKEDPALLEWEGNNRYKAFIYPIKAGRKRTVLIRYSSWLKRTGKEQDIRNYTFPLTGVSGVSPEYEEFSVSADLRKSGAVSARANFNVHPDGGFLEFSASEFQSSSDFNIELKDNGIRQNETTGFYTMPPGRSPARPASGDYLYIRLNPFKQSEVHSRNLSVVFLVDVSADMSDSEFNMARLAVEKTVASLRPDDKVAVITGDLAFRENYNFSAVKNADVAKMLEALSFQKKGGATDLWELLETAAAKFGNTKSDHVPILIYIGNGKPTVGEISGKRVGKKWKELPYNIILKALITGEGEGSGFFEQITEEDPLIISDPSSIKFLKEYFYNLRKPVLENFKLSFDETPGRVYPHNGHSFVVGETMNISGILRSKHLPGEVTLSGVINGKEWKRSFKIRWKRFYEIKELKYRWATARLNELINSGASPEELMDLGLQYGLVTPYTSLYVPTAAETEETVSKDTEDTAKEGEKSDKSVADEVKVKAEAPRLQKAKRLLPVATQGIGGGGGLGGSFGRMGGKGRPRARKHRRKHYYKKRKAGRFSDKQKRSAKPLGGATGIPVKSLTSSRRKGKRGYVRKSSGYTRRNKSKVQTLNIQNSVTGGGFSGKLKTLTGKKLHIRKPVIKEKKYSKKELKQMEMVFRQKRTVKNITNNFFITCLNCSWKHRPDGCSAASKLPLWQRKKIWKERLRNITPYTVLTVYGESKRLCELPTFHSRMVFLRLSVSMMRNVHDLVKLYRIFPVRYGYSRYLQSAIIASISNIKDLLFVKKSFGFNTVIEQNKVEEMLQKADSFVKKEKILKDLIHAGMKNPWIYKTLLSLYEENSKTEKSETLISSFFGKPLLDNYLRLYASEILIKHKKVVQARRLLSETVEFYPRNPEKRKLLGRLYRGFGWYKRALREFQTLTALTGNSKESRLWLALAYKDTKKYEKSLKLMEDILSKTEPGGYFVKLTRAFACTELAELKIKNPKEKANINKRGKMAALFRNDEAVKILLIYDKPYEYFSFLWGASFDELLNVPFGKPEWGVSGVITSKLPGKTVFTVKPQEISDSGTKAVLVILLNEGTVNEKIMIRTLKFDSKDTKYEFIFKKAAAGNSGYELLLKEPKSENFKKVEFI